MTILITGSVSGIGYATGLELARRGHLVYMSVENKEQLEELKRKLKKFEYKENIKEMVLNICDDKDRKKTKKLDLDVLFCNAAIGEGGSISEIPMEKVRKNFEVNVFANFTLIQEVLKEMITKDKGKIVVMSSILGIVPFKFLGVYSATKASIIALTTTLRKELKLLHSNIKVCLIEPGAYHTGFNQKMLDNKYKWMNSNSYFKSIKTKIKKKEEKRFKSLEQDDLYPLVRKIVRACEAKNPKKVYAAPNYQYYGVKLISFFR